MQLRGRTVLVTGASSGIGRELAVLLAERGCHVVLSGRDSERLRAAAEAVDGTVIQAELASAQGVEHLVRKIAEGHPNVSIVVNNAAVQLNYLLDELPAERALEVVSRELQIDLIAPIQICTLLLPLLQREAARSGRPSAIVNLTSGLALAPKKSAAVYCTAKAGLRTFTKALRHQMNASWHAGGPDVRAVEAMLPLVDTPMTAGRGKGKISPARAALEIVDGLEREHDEVYVGRTRVLRILYRLMPAFTERMFRNA